MAQINYLIVEDEYYSAVELREMMQTLRPAYRLSGITEDVEGTVDFLRDNHVDLIISDITLPDGLSFDILRNTGSNVPVIFITAYRDYKSMTRDFNTAAFLLKPVSEKSLAGALDNYERKISAKNKKSL